MAPRAKTGFIYTLSDPATGKIRYVGQTANPVRREQLHCSPHSGRGNRKLNHWLGRLFAKKLKPAFAVIEDCEDMDARERHWIAAYRAKGEDLLNMNEGGSDNRFMLAAPRSHVAKGKRDILHDRFHTLRQAAKWFRSKGMDADAWYMEYAIERGYEGIKKLGREEACRRLEAAHAVE